MKMNREAIAAGTVVALLFVVAAAAVAATPRGWAAVKAETAKYHRVDAAIAAGYTIEGEPCIEEAPGAMGIHAVNLALMPPPGPTVDPLRPQILLYLPQANGSLRLVGVEYFMVALVNTPDGPAPWFSHDDPRDQGLTFFNPAPSVLGQTFDGPMAGHNPEMPWHYDLHVWLWAHNPDGLFAPFNPALSCPAG
jgi:hypothetical protein